MASSIFVGINLRGFNEFHSFKDIIKMVIKDHINTKCHQIFHSYAHQLNNYIVHRGKDETMIGVESMTVYLLLM